MLSMIKPSRPRENLVSIYLLIIAILYTLYFAQEIFLPIIGAFIISLLLIISVLIFSLQNIAAVEIQFLLWSFSVPRALMVAILLGIGFIIGLLFCSLVFHRRR